MDPFTQRMLERAKIRREKLNSHFAQETDVPPGEIIKEKVNEQAHLTVPKDENSGGKPEKGDHSNTRKIKLQKLALFYAGKKDLSFEKENNEDINLESQSQVKKPKYKLGRLAELTTRINEWEDELNRPKPLKVLKPAQAQNTEGVKDNGKQKIWNPIVDKLCSQGYTLSDSQSKLTYDFQSENVCPTQRKEGIHDSVLKSALRSNQTESVISQKDGDNGKHDYPVSSKVAFFEGGNKNETKKQAKDPAELSLAERKALFERNSSSNNFTPNTHFTRPTFRSHSQADEFRSGAISDSKVCNRPAKVDFEAPKDTKTSGSPASKGSNVVNVCGEELSPNRSPINAYNENIASDECLEDNECAEVESEFNAKEANSSLSQPSKDDKIPRVTEHITKNSQWESPSHGRLYPSLSTLDVSEVTSPSISEADDLNESKNSNICLNMSLSDLLEMNKNNPITPPGDLSFSKSKECQVLNKMDKLLENALNNLSSETEDEYQEVCPSPPKIMKSSSFEYKSSDSENQRLLHTVSFYRKQQQSYFSPEKDECEPDVGEDETISVENKIQLLIAEVNKQQTIMSQASQALNLCLSTVEFSGSGEQVEGERLLLLASHKRQACLNEIQRLKVENCVRPRGDKSLAERGDVTLTNITIRLKRDALRAMAAAESLQYFVCLIKSDERVLATPVVAATRENLTDGNLQFPGSIKLEELFSNFRVTIEIYSLELSKEFLPHDLKYHISNKKDKKLLTPIKARKVDSRLVKPQVQSPAGPNAVRTTSFQMCGYVVFSLKELNRTQWILNKVPHQSSLEAALSMNIHSQLRLDKEFRGFLTMFDDISGFGAWHRRWCLLSSHLISFWKYPDDEQKKVPIGTIDLRSVITENVGLVPRDICARLNTFLLETTRPRLPEDENSLVLRVEDGVTTIRHLLSADSKQEMLTWCKKLNAILGLLRSWKCNTEG